MSFEALLREIVEGCGGGIGAALMGNDGIPIEQVTASQAVSSPLAEDIATAGTEFGRILEEIRKASDAIAGGALTEASVVLDRFSIVFRVIDSDTFMAVVVAPNGNLGKARYLMRRYQLAIRQEL